MIDCGHGGKDPGFVGVDVTEKEFALSLGFKLKKLLEEQGFGVRMTRDGDTYLTLDQRTACVNALKNVAALVSIHANATHNQNTSGIETYSLDTHAFKNKHTVMGEYDAKTLALYKKMLAQKSKKLAALVHEQMLNEARTFNESVVDRKVKHNPGQVLFGEAPSVLVECGFLSNKKEGALLQNDEYQYALARAIVSGITAFLQTSFA